MSMSTFVVGYRPPDEKWRAMETIWKACKAAGIEPPEEVEEFFDDGDPTDKPGMNVDIDEAATEFSEEGCVGIEIDMSKLPKGLRYIRFYNSW